MHRGKSLEAGERETSGKGKLEVRRKTSLNSKNEQKARRERCGGKRQ